MKGVIYPTFGVEYQFDGLTWIVHIKAVDEIEARRRLRAIGMTGQIVGELVASIPVAPSPGWLGRIRRALGL